MKAKEFDILLNKVLEEETRKMIEEEITEFATLGLAAAEIRNNIRGTEKTMQALGDKIKSSFQSISELADKITNVDGDEDKFVIKIDGVSPTELIDCCGGESLGQAQTNLMQGLHHDLDESDFNKNYDVDINTEGDEESLQLTITVTPNDDELSKEKDMKEVEDNGELSNTFGQPMYEKETKDTNPTAKGDKDVILGGDGEDEVDEQWQAAAGAVAGEMIAGKALGSAVPAAVRGAVATGIGNKITDALGGNDEVDEQCGPKEVDEHHKKDKESRIDFILKNKGLEKLSDEEIEKIYLSLEKKLGLNESKKKVVRLNESEMEELLKKIILEAQVESPNIPIPPRGVPGLDVTNKNLKDSGKQNSDALKAVEKKIKDYLSFDGNTDPEFPDPVGKGDEKVATQNTPSEDEVVELERGRHMADLTYDQEPSERFKERARLSLVGAAEMGNSQDYGNVIPSKTGENIAKAAEKRKEAYKDEPMYEKEAVPVDDEPKDNRSGEGAVASEILRMKQMAKYNEKTQ